MKLSKQLETRPAQGSWCFSTVKAAQLGEKKRELGGKAGKFVVRSNARSRALTEKGKPSFHTVKRENAQGGRAKINLVDR